MLNAFFMSMRSKFTSADATICGAMKPAAIVRRSRPAKSAKDVIGTGGGLAPPAPNILANAASFITPALMLTAVTPNNLPN